MKRIAAALLLLILLAPAASAVTLIEPSGIIDNNLSLLLDSDYVIDGAAVGGAEILYEDTPLLFSAQNASGINIEISPAGSGLSFLPLNFGIDMAELPIPAAIYGKLTTNNDTKPKEYKIKVTAFNTAGQTDSKTYTFKIYPEPKISSSTPATVTWGKEYSFTPTASGVSYWEIVDESIDKSKYLEDLPDGLELDVETGRIYGTWKAGDDEDGLAFGTDKTELSRKIRLRAWQANGEKYAERDYTLKFAAVAPVISDDVNYLNKEYFSKMKYDEEVSVAITAEAPGVVSWTASNLPDGFEIDSDDGDGVSTLTVTGTPQALMTAQAVTFTARNSVGTASISPKFTVGYDGTLAFTDDAQEYAPEGVYAVGMSPTDEPIDYDFGDEMAKPKSRKNKNSKDSYDDDEEEEGYGIISAYPGPFTWQAKGLPDGITISPINSSTAKFTGTFKKAGTFKYTLTATNTVLKKSISMTKTITVYTKPVITTASLSAISVGKKYSAKLAASNTPIYWHVSFASGSNPDEYAFTEDEYDVDGASENVLTWDAKKQSITGMIDAVPEDTYLTVRVEAENPAGTGVKDFKVKVNGKAPAFKTKSLPTMTAEDGGNAEIAATGSLPITLGAYIDAKSAKNIFGVNSQIDLTDDDNITGLFFDYDEDEGTGTLELASGAGYAYKALPITFTAKNMTVNVPVTKQMKFTVTGSAPTITMLDDNEDEVETTAAINITAGSLGTGGTESYKFRITGDKPISVTSSQAWGTNAKNGIYNTYETTEEYTDVTLFITPQSVAKETKTALTLTAANTSTGAKATKKITIINQLGPTITTKEKGLIKEVEAGKKLSLKLAAKGSSPLTWNVTDTDGEDAEDILASYGLKFDSKKGIFTGTTTKPTYNDNGDYAPLKLLATVSNYSGTSKAATVSIGIKGKKPKFKTKTLTFSRTDPDFASNKLETNISNSDTTSNVKYSVIDSKLKNIGLVIGESRNNEGILAKSGDLKATKGTSVKITASNYGGIATGNVKFVINDPTPELDAVEIGTIYAKENTPVSKTVTLTLKEAPTGDTKLKWAISEKPSVSGIKATLKANAKGSEAVLTLTVPKKFTGSGATTAASLGVTVTNTNTKSAGKKSFEFNIAAYNAPQEETPQDDAAKPRNLREEPKTPDEELPDEQDYEPTGLTIGTERDVAGLSASQLAFAHDNGYVIAAVLPEISADVSGQYDIDVTLDGVAPVGAELHWFAFPQNAEPSDDDEIADFYDMTGEDIYTVPEDREITVAPWLRENVIYAPVIMVK